MRLTMVAVALLAAMPLEGQEIFTMTVAEYTALQAADQHTLAGYVIGLYQMSSHPDAMEAKACAEKWAEQPGGVKDLGSWMRDAVLLGFRVESGSDLLMPLLVAALIDTCR